MALAQVSFFSELESGTEIKVSVRSTSSQERAESIPRAIASSFGATITQGPETAQKGRLFGSVTHIRIGENLTREMVVSLVREANLESPATVTIERTEPSIADALIDGLTFGPTRRAIASGAATARDAANQAQNSLEGFGNGIKDVLQTTSGIVLATQFVIYIGGIILLVYLWKKGFFKGILNAG